MNYFLTEKAALKLLETPSVYHIVNDELYELDDESYCFLRDASSENGVSSGETEFITYCLDEGILTTDKVQAKRPPLTPSPEPSLRYLELQITDRCNLRCRHCYISPPSADMSSGGSELRAATIKKVLREFEEMQGLRLLVTGGEPLLHTEFPVINSMLPDFAFRKVLFTNGLLLGRERVRSLRVDEIQISIDGLEGSHDAIRGKGSFRSALDAIRTALDEGFEVSVATMVHSGNLGDFGEMERLFNGMGITDWTVDVPCVSGRLSENPDLHVSPEVAGRYLGYGYGGGLHAGAPGFGCGLHLMSVTADGRAAKCTFYADSPAGQIEDGLRECWLKIPPVRLDALACDCDFKDSCRGGCRYRAKLLGDPLGKDLYRCSYYDIMKSDAHPE